MKSILLIMTTMFPFLVLNAQMDDSNRRTADSLVREKDYKGLLSYLSPFIAGDTRDSMTLFYNGYAHFMLNNPGDAEVSFQKILDENPNNPAANEYLAAIYLSTFPEEACIYLHKLIQLQPTAGAHYRDLGDLFSKAGNKDSAYWYYRTGYSLDTNDLKLVARFANILIDSARFAEADLILDKRMTGRDSLNPVLLRLKLSNAFQSKQFDQAIGPGEKLLQRQETSAAVLNQLLVAYFSLRRFSDCLRVGEWLELNQTANELTYYYEAQCNAEGKRYQTGNLLLRTCLSLAISRTAETYYYSIGQNLEKTGRYRQAIAHYDTAYYLFRNPMMLYYIGRIYDVAFRNEKKADQYFYRFRRMADKSKPDEKKILEYLKRRFAAG